MTNMELSQHEFHSCSSVRYLQFGCSNTSKAKSDTPL